MNTKVRLGSAFARGEIGGDVLGVRIEGLRDGGTALVTPNSLSPVIAYRYPNGDVVSFSGWDNRYGDLMKSCGVDPNGPHVDRVSEARPILSELMNIVDELDP